MMISAMTFFFAVLTFFFVMKNYFCLLVVLELFSFSFFFFCFFSKNQFFFAGLFILVMSAVLGLILFFLEMMDMSTEKTSNTLL